MPTTTRFLSTAEQRRDEVIMAATHAFAERGYWGANTTEIAAAAGISQAYLYRLFANKEALFVAVLDAVKHRIREGIDRVLSDGDHPVDVDALLSPAAEGVVDDRASVMVLLHATAAAVVPLIGEAVRACYREQAEYLIARGVRPTEVRAYLAWAQYDNALRAAGIGGEPTDPRDRDLVRA